MPTLYLSQQRLDEWVEQERVTLEAGDRMTMANGKGFRLEPAVFFEQVVGGDADPHDLLGKVKTKSKLDAMSAEHYRDSVIVGDAAYQVVEGFVGQAIE